VSFKISYPRQNLLQRKRGDIARVVQRAMRFSFDRQLAQSERTLHPARRKRSVDQLIRAPGKARTDIARRFRRFGDRSDHHYGCRREMGTQESWEYFLPAPVEVSEPDPSMK
jgi:hypothetical protein